MAHTTGPHIVRTWNRNYPLKQVHYWCINPASTGMHVMNRFEMMDGPEDGIVLLKLWREHEIVYGTVTVPRPIRDLGTHFDTPIEPAPMPGALAVASAASIGNQLKMCVGVNAQEGTWAAEWGELVPRGTLAQVK
jgi:hypothetical protein